jgi:hypothetical protein
MLLVNVILKIHIKTHFVVFSHLGFHVKLFCIVHMWLYVYDMLNEIIS